MNKTTRGFLILIGIIVFVSVFCFWIPFKLLPGAGIGVALPVISVPGEVLVPDFFDIGAGYDLTNTLVGLVLADIVILLMLLALYLTGGVKAVPGRLQSMLELFVDYMYGLAKSVAGSNAGRIFPLIMGIFMFLLVANWLELVPGVDSVGLMHCAPSGLNGYPANVEEGAPIEGVVTLKVDRALYSGEKATEADFCACEAINLGHFPADESAHCIVALAEAGVAVPAAELSAAEAELGHEDSHEDSMEETDEAHTEEGEDEGHAEDAADDGHEEDDDHGHGLSEDLVAAVAAADEEGLVKSELFIVTPFVRAAATDLNMTVALAVIAVIAVQVFGVWSLGPNYFQKFINLRALGNLGKNPMGAMDFAVGLLEIVSEISRILSFAFRLFGNIFGGQVLLFVMAFLVATMLPAIFYGFELFVGLIQAFVFAMLTLAFSAQAMEGHGDDH